MDNFAMDIVHVHICIRSDGYKVHIFVDSDLLQLVAKLNNNYDGHCGYLEDFDRFVAVVTCYEVI